MAAVADPADFEDLRRLIEARADVVASLGTDLTRRLSTSSWAGPAADQYKASVDELRQRLATDADRMRAMAISLQRLSDALAAELDHLRLVEARVREWLATNPQGIGGVPPPWPATDLPPTGDPRWMDVETAFKPLGIV